MPETVTKRRPGRPPLLGGKVQICYWIRQEHYDFLLEESTRRKTPMAEIVREALDTAIFFSRRGESNFRNRVPNSQPTDEDAA